MSAISSDRNSIAAQQPQLSTTVVDLKDLCSSYLQDSTMTMQQETAARINNYAVSLYNDGRYEAALVLCKENLALLNSLDFQDYPKDTSSNGRIGRRLSWEASEVTDFYQAVQIPCDVEFFRDDTLARSEDVVSVFVMYNLFLVLHVSGNSAAALEILEMVRSIVQPFSKNEDNRRWHPSFILSIQYHLGILAFQCNEKELAWQIFVQAVEVGKTLTLTNRSLYGKLCLQIGGIMMEEHLFHQAETAFEEAASVYQQTLCYNIYENDAQDSSDESSFAAAAA